MTEARPGSGEMFDAIAPRYDLLNRILSLGLDQGWRKKTVRALAPPAGGTALDLATGTGDLALMIARTYPDAKILGTDPSRGMLDIAATKARPFGDRISFSVGDSQAIELPDASVDAISMAFGIRNVPDRPRALREMARVLEPGGRVAILELTEPKGGVLASLSRLYVHEIVPRVGAALSGAREYRYLQRSIAAFPPADAFAALMREAGLDVIEVAPLTFGVAHLFVGRR